MRSTPDVSSYLTSIAAAYQQDGITVPLGTYVTEIDLSQDFLDNSSAWIFSRGEQDVIQLNKQLTALSRSAYLSAGGMLW